MKIFDEVRRAPPMNDALRLFKRRYDDSRVQRGMGPSRLEDARWHWEQGHSPEYAAFVDEGVEVAEACANGEY
jgi:hypothetical protein